MATIVTNVLGAELKGSTGNVTFVRTPYGTVVRDRIVPRDPQTHSQQMARRRMSLTAMAWRTLSPEQSEAWQAYARSLSTGRKGAPFRPQLEFWKLAMTFLAINPEGAVPLLPPEAAFTGDAVDVTVTAAPGGVRFSADIANHPGVATELLLQPLESVHRRAYPAKFRTQEYFGFGTDLTREVAAQKGVYACAVRFVRTTTGQASALVELGKVVVS